MNLALGEAYGHLQQAIVAHGRLACERAALAIRAGEEVVVREKSFMGVAFPVVRISLPKLLPGYGFLETGVSMDAVSTSIRGSLEVIAELAEIEVGLFRLMAEIKRTIKRVNALENIYIRSMRQPSNTWRKSAGKGKGIFVPVETAKSQARRGRQWVCLRKFWCPSMGPATHSMPYAWRRDWAGFMVPS